MITMHILVIVLVTTCSKRSIVSEAALRVYQGRDDDTSKYPYVVSIQPLRLCTGSLLTAKWVLTAAHCCIKQAKMIQYGNMSIPVSKSESKRVVLKMIPHPRYREGILTANDIGLFLVSPVVMDSYARLSAVDYSTLEDASAEYAGYGLTFLPRKLTQSVKKKLALSFQKQLQIGEAIIKHCAYWFKGFICISPKCSVTQLVSSGDSGGPLFIDKKIVAVVSGTVDDEFQNTDRHFTPVSPHLVWVRSVMTSKIDETK